MKRFILVLVLFFTTLGTVEATKLKNEIQNIWSVSKIETTDPNLNILMQGSDFSKYLVEFTKSGFVIVLGKDTKTKYHVSGDKIILSEGMVKEMSQTEVKANIKSGNLTVNVPADLVKQILLTVKEQYSKSGGDSFVAMMIENIAKTYRIEAVIVLKRK
ncbi:MAG: hypothetical protein LBS55_03105 [Prevotellaceae bacterium]|jgi:hypothetical protein|nr:hypothetical protein [Prevotellaceae bacterium]